VKENALKDVLKETLETLALAASGGDANPSNVTSTENSADAVKADFHTKGDEEAFAEGRGHLAKDDADLLKDIPSAIGRRVRLRRIPDPDRAPDVAEYSMASVTGWKMETQSNGADGEAPEKDPGQQPIWRLGLDDGGELHISVSELVEGIVRSIKWATEYPGYVEHDAPFLSYRNSLGRYCGRAVEAPSSSTPQAFARQLIKKEQDLYTPLKNRTFENNWGGKAGARQAWVSSLKETGHDFEAVREGLLTLENAFFDLTGGFGTISVNAESNSEGVPAPQTDSEPGTQTNGGTKLSGKDLLYDDESRFDIELESLGTEVKGLWNNQDAREIFQEIIRKSKTVSILALGLDLICRNAQAYINRTKSSAVAQKSADSEQAGYTGRRRAAARPGAYSDFFK
jgi:hypothetical protein